MPDDPSIAERKRLLRQEATARRTSVSPKDAVKWSRKILARVLALPEIKAAKTVSVYCSFGSEARTHELIEALAQAGKRVCLPRVDGSPASMSMYAFKSLAALQPSAFGFPEPPLENHVKAPEKEIDVILTPGLAFDARGHRLGFGMAFYDRFVAGMPKRVPVLALAYECQIFPEVPVTERDVKVDKVVTEKRVIEANR